jgi:uncharacterized protein YjbI with pentapeptide repeats
MSGDHEEHPTTDDRDAWKAYWNAQGVPWRTDPEIDAKRQQYLAERRAVKPNIDKGIYPFRHENGSIKLTRADLEWLLATHEDNGWRGPIDWSNEYQRGRTGVDLRGADLQGLDLSLLPLAGICAGLRPYEWEAATPEVRKLAVASLERTTLHLAHLEGAVLVGAHLEGVDLGESRLESALLNKACLQRANLREAHLENAYLMGTNIQAFDTMADTLSQGREPEASAIEALEGAHLEGANLFEAFLMEAKVNGAHLEGANLGSAHLEDAYLIYAHLEGANLFRAFLDRAELVYAHLEGADLRSAYLRGTALIGAHFEGTTLPPDDLSRVRQWNENFAETLPPAKLADANFDATTNLTATVWGDYGHQYTLFVDVGWGGANLAVIDWDDIGLVGDEREARKRKSRDGKRKEADTRLEEFQDAIRANQQLASVLRSQGLSEYADRYAFRAHVLRRTLQRKQRRWLRYFGSLLFGLSSGYGYKPLRSVATYLLLILGFAVTYYLLGDNTKPALDLNGAVVFSITSFHGRGFAPGGSLSPDNPITALAASEAVIGLVIEITFIATFTQRFFAR